MANNSSLLGEKSNYIHMVQFHGSVQLSYGATSISAIIDADFRHIFHFIDEKDGNPRTPHKKLISDILCMTKVNDNKV